MATNVTLNGVTYSIPAEGDGSWGTVLSNFFISIASNVLQKTGGTFTLTAEANFGATYGLKSAYLKSQGTNISSVGVVRLANLEKLAWRNAANDADIYLTVDASDKLSFNGTVLSGPSVTGTRAAPYAVVAGTGIPFSGSAHDNIYFIEGSGGAVTVVANPQIAAGTSVGQKLTLVLRNASNPVTFSDGTGLVLNGSVMVMDQVDLPKNFLWDGTNWISKD